MAGPRLQMHAVVSPQSSNVKEDAHLSPNKLKNWIELFFLSNDVTLEAPLYYLFHSGDIIVL